LLNLKQPFKSFIVIWSLRDRGRGEERRGWNREGREKADRSG
jgi:hypothetical protein